MPLPVASGGGNWSWQDARRRFHEALTNPTKDDTPDRKGRDTAFSELFEALGRLSHLIQDASVPAHVRNDPHLIRDGYERHVHRLQQAPAGSGRRARFDAWLNRAPVRPPDTIFGPTGHPQAPVPIARLIDTNLFLGGNFDVLGRPDLGIAEYTNGNFLSDDTIFDDFALPRRSGLGRDFFEPEGGGFRRYFEKTSVEGEAIRHFVAESALYEAALAEAGPMAEALTLTRRTYEDYAEFLLPRAVGYSAALLDYVFRGKLDLDLVSDDGSTLQLRGTNASIDALVEGTLTLYADVPTLDPEGRPTTVRRELTALGDTTVRGVDPRQPLSSALFQPQEADRFVAVYQGRLGNEIPVPDPDIPTLSFPGAVIGRVLGGVRVEEVFAGANGQWTLRSPTGVFALHDAAGPLTTARFPNLRWGDGPDDLLAWTFGGLRQVPRFAAARVPRQPNSVEPVTEDLAGLTIVRLAPLVPVTPFPATVPALTTLIHTEVIDYRQQLVMADWIRVREWRPIFPDLPENDGTNYQFTGVEPGAVSVETVNPHQFRFTDTVSVALDPDHHGASDPDRLSYSWHVADVGLTADGHIVAVVQVTLHPPLFAFQPRLTQPMYILDAQGNLVAAQTCGFFGCQPFEVAVFRSYPGELTPLLWAVVDVTTGQVLATTAEPALAITTHQAVEAPQTLVSIHVFERLVGGPRPTAQDIPRTWAETGTRPWDGQPFATTTDLTLLAGEPRAVEGWYRPEIRGALTSAGLLGLAGGSGGGTSTLAFGELGPNQHRLVLHSAPTPPEERRPRLDLALRGRPAPGGERLAFLVHGFIPGQGQTQAIAAWDLVSEQARVGHVQPLGFAETGLDLVEATGRLALVNWSEFGRSYLIPLDGTAPVRVFEGPGALFRFRLLGPQHLYHVDVQRFFRLDPALQATPLPARLRTLDPNPTLGDYHAIRLP